MSLHAFNNKTSMINFLFPFSYLMLLYKEPVKKSQPLTILDWTLYNNNSIISLNYQVLALSLVWSLFLSPNLSFVNLCFVFHYRAQFLLTLHTLCFSPKSACCFLYGNKVPISQTMCIGATTNVNGSLNGIAEKCLEFKYFRTMIVYDECGYQINHILWQFVIVWGLYSWIFLWDLANCE